MKKPEKQRKKSFDWFVIPLFSACNKTWTKPYFLIKYKKIISINKN